MCCKYPFRNPVLDLKYIYNFNTQRDSIPGVEFVRAQVASLCNNNLFKAISAAASGLIMVVSQDAQACVFLGTLYFNLHVL